MRANSVSRSEHRRPQSTGHSHGTLLMTKPCRNDPIYLHTQFGISRRIYAFSNANVPSQTRPIVQNRGRDLHQASVQTVPTGTNESTHHRMRRIEFVVQQRRRQANEADDEWDDDLGGRPRILHARPGEGDDAQRCTGDDHRVPTASRDASMHANETQKTMSSGLIRGERERTSSRWRRKRRCSSRCWACGGGGRRGRHRRPGRTAGG